MPTDYKQIAEENIKRYGTAIDEYGPLLLSDRYSDRTHFVYELLQNAEDAIGWRLARNSRFPRNVAFELSHNELVFRHFGLAFAEEHVRGICNIGKGTKRHDLTVIGKHGIGFKSVYAYTHHPEVHSGKEHFEIDSFVRPCAVKSKATSSGETKFFLPFDHPEIRPERAYTEIAARLKVLGLTTLLFLRNIESITWRLDCGEKGKYLREAKPVADGIERVTLLGSTAAAAEVREEWLVFRKPVQHEGRSAGAVEIAFALEAVDKKKSERIVRVSESPLVVFFPTERETYFGFLVQGPYRTTPSRDNIPKDDPWNRHLVAKTSQLLLQSLTQLRDSRLLTVSALEALVVDLSKYSPGSQVSMFAPIADAVVDALKKRPLIPRFGNGYIAGANAYLARAESLRELVAPAQLKRITDSKTDTAWVTGEITHDRTPTLRDFLVDSLGIKEIDSEAFVYSVSEQFLRDQSDDWLGQFYGFLIDRQAVRREPWFANKPIIRLEDGSHVAPLRPDGSPNAYLPSGERTEFPTVKKAVCKHEVALRFLTMLGLKEPDPVDDVIHNILPRYLEQPKKFPRQYDDDIKRIVEAFQTDSARRKTELTDQLRKAWWIPCRNAESGELILGVAEHSTYLPTQKLLALFANNSNVWFVDRSRKALQGKRCQAVSGSSCHKLVGEHAKCGHAALPDDDQRTFRGSRKGHD